MFRPYRQYVNNTGGVFVRLILDDGLDKSRRDFGLPNSEATRRSRSFIDLRRTDAADTNVEKPTSEVCYVH